MNRRDATFLAHLDAIEGRLTGYLVQILGRLAQIEADIAGIKVELTLHRHDESKS